MRDYFRLVYPIDGIPLVESDIYYGEGGCYHSVDDVTLVKINSLLGEDLLDNSFEHCHQ